MNRLLTGAVAVAGLLTTLSSCSDTFDPSSTSDRQGRILVNVGLDKEVAAPRAMSKAPAAEADAIGVSDLSIRLSSVDGSSTWSWNSVDEMPVSAEYPVGGYKLEAFYGDENTEGFDAPYYYGSQTLTVLENKSTPVSLTASLANSMVTVVFTDAVKDYFASVSGSVESSTGLKTAYTVDETRAVYVKPGSTTVSVDVTKQSGVSAKLSPVTFNAEARHHYTVTFDVNGGETGKAVLTVTFNSDLDEKEEIIDLSDEILTAPAPAISLTGFQSGETFTMVEGSRGDNLRATVVAQAGMGTVVMTTSSASLLSQGWPAEVDFATAGAATLAKLRELGLQFHGLEGELTQMALLDFSNVISHIAYIDGGNNITEINFIAKDKVTKVSEPASLKVAIEKLALEVVNIETLEPDQTELTFDVSYNGTNFDNVKFEVRNERNTWDAVSPVSIAPVSRAASVYRVALPVAADGNVVFRVSCGSLVTDAMTVSRNILGAEINDNDVFATHAALVLTDDGAVAEGTQLFLSTDGVTFAPATATASGNTLVFSGLNPGTSYVAKVEKDGMRSKKLPFTTEAATQLPNAGFDEWASEQKGDYQYLWTITNSSWATLNPLTLSNNGSGSGNGLTTGGCAYKATSGTIPANGRSTQSTAGGGWIGTEKHSDGHTEGNATLHSDKQRSGANAALVRTVGWGSGNAAASNSSGFGTCQNATAGELFLGVCQDNSPVYGYAFASRPSSLSFYYRYEVVSAGNGDFGTAEISVLDKDGNVIATADKVLGEQSAYTQVEMPLTYTSKEKAAQIRVIFRSSGFDGAISNKNTTFWHKPGSKNTSGGEFVGSELYIDDVVLNYN